MILTGWQLNFAAKTGAVRASVFPSNSPRRNENRSHVQPSIGAEHSALNFVSGRAKRLLEAVNIELT